MTVTANLTFISVFSKKKKKKKGEMQGKKHNTEFYL